MHNTWRRGVTDTKSASEMSVIHHVREALKSPSVALERALVSAAMEFNFTSFKDVQGEAIAAAINGKDVFVSVPTGYGKSAIYEALPSCAKNLLAQKQGRDLRADLHPFVLVVSPLVSLIQDQVAKLRPRAAYLSKEANHTPESVRDGVLTGEFTHVFSSPEAILSVRKWREILYSDWLSVNLLAIAAHCIVKW